jgi:nucleoredoxin
MASLTTDWTSFFGETLAVNGSPAVPTAARLQGKYVMVYFSAHWCGPCRQFTPALAQFYTSLKATRDDFELVFVSSDRDDAGFDEYFGSMPWTAMPFSERAKKAELSSRYGVQGIPSLVVLNKDGSVISKNAREALMGDPTGASFPWIPKPIGEMLGSSFVGAGGAVVDRSAIEGKYVGLYFSAHWCPPCQQFTPKLITYYNHRKSIGKNDFEIIFCSSDKSQEEFDGYFGSMPWLALPLKDSRIGELSSRLEVQGIPSFVILDPAGEVVTSNGRAAILGDMNSGKVEDGFPYHPAAVADLSESAECCGFDINSKAAVIVFMENADDDEQADAKGVLSGFAETMTKAKAKSPEGPEMLFFYSFQPNEIGDKVRQLCKLAPLGPKSTTTVILLNIPDNGGYYVAAGDEVTKESMGTFLEAFKAGTLERKQLG